MKYIDVGFLAWAQERHKPLMGDLTGGMTKAFLWMIPGLEMGRVFLQGQEMQM